MTKNKNRQNPANNLLTTIGFVSLFIMVLVFYLVVGGWIDKMKQDERKKVDLISALRLEKDQLEVKKESLYLDQNILRLAKRHINRHSKQASPKGSVYIGNEN
tara:strand:- start:38 stop:346 length:309 start_codon:yes stop_codon:yes gene_type:complete